LQISFSSKYINSFYGFFLKKHVSKHCRFKWLLPSEQGTSFLLCCLVLVRSLVPRRNRPSPRPRRRVPARNEGSRRRATLLSAGNLPAFCLAQPAAQKMLSSLCGAAASSPLLKNPVVPPVFGAGKERGANPSPGCTGCSAQPVSRVPRSLLLPMGSVSTGSVKAGELCGVLAAVVGLSQPVPPVRRGIAPRAPA